MKVETAEVSPDSCPDSAAAAVISCGSPNAENPTAKTDRVSSTITAMAAILAFIWSRLPERILVSSGKVAQFYIVPPVIATTAGPVSWSSDSPSPLRERTGVRVKCLVPGVDNVAHHRGLPNPNPPPEEKGTSKALCPLRRSDENLACRTRNLGRRPC